MNDAVVRNALGSLDKSLSSAKEALWDIQREVFGNPGFGQPGGYADPRAAMAAFLAELYENLLVVLEAADMPQTRSFLILEWRGLSGGGGLAKTNENHEFDFVDSPALTFLERLIQGLRISVSGTISSEEAWTLSRLVAMLRDTPNLVHRRGQAPASEHELQQIMHDYLDVCFPDFVRSPRIHGTLKNFDPDCGIRSVGAAIEFKFVRTKDQVATAYSGIVEDTGGYKGSKDWTRFYSVIYQAEPFASESKFRNELKRIGAGTWEAFVVHGPAEGSKAPSKNAGGRKKAK
jgi:hypothetical protein